MKNNHTKLIPRKIRESNWPEAYFLTEEQQSQYEESIKKYSGKARESLNIPREGSNLFKVVLLNQEGIRTATLSELELALENGMNLKGTFEDIPSVVLRSNGDSYEPNDYLAKLLFEEVKKRNENEKLEHSLVLSGLKLKEDSDSAYGLILKPADNFSYFEAPELDHKNNGKRFLRLNEKGMPIFDKNGSRVLYTRDKGLSRLYLYEDLILFNVVHLTNSFGNGRVVVVSPQGAKKNLDDLDEYVKQVKTARENFLKTGKLYNTEKK